MIKKPLGRTSALALVLLLAWTSQVLHVQAAGPTSAASSSSASFTLDGVDIVLQADSLPDAAFVVAEAGAASQVASSTSWNPFKEFSLTAVPFGSTPGMESVPAAASGGAPAYLEALRSYRVRQGALVKAAAQVTLFGKAVPGIQSLVTLNIDGPTAKPIIIDEWVAEAGSRLWIARISETQAADGMQAQAMAIATGISIGSSTLDHSTTLVDNRINSPLAAAASADTSAASADLPAAAWWNGVCDTNNYSNAPANTNHVAAYPLGASYLGMQACGPRPWSDGAPNVMVRFFSGAWGELEWQCVELSMRFLYLKYGISPYDANGSQVVWNYSGTKLSKISNGGVGQAPVPGDVLSMGSTSTYGHTAVVTASNVNASGNGTVTIIEENASPTGTTNLTVSNWAVAGNAGAVSGWLHDPSGNAAVGVAIAAAPVGSYALPVGTAIRESYTTVNNGPVKLMRTGGTNSIVASERVAYSPDGGATWTSYTELMGLPSSQLTDTYYFPWYNSTNLSSQISVGNVGTSSTTVTVTIGGTQVDSYALAANASQRVKYTGVNTGPVIVHSSGGVPIIVTERISYTPDGTHYTGYSELMGLPASQLTDTYYFSYYNSVSLSEQVSVANVGGTTTTVTVTIGGTQVDGYDLAPSQSKRVKYPGINNGPVVVHSSGGTKIIASERISYTPDGGATYTGYSEMMGLPSARLTDTYAFPWYNSVDHSMQVSAANVGSGSTTVTVTINGTLVDSYTLAQNASKRVKYAGITNGPLVVHSSGGIKIIASERTSYTADGGASYPSFSEMLGLPGGLMTDTYWFPWYNNVNLNTELRFGVP